MNTKIKYAIVGALGLVAGGAYNSIADVLVTAGAGTTVFDFVCFATKHCPTAVLTNSAGTEIATAGAPVRVDPTGTTPQPVTMTSTTITGTVAVTESGTWTVQPGNTANTTPWLFNESQINGVTPLMGNGVTGTGSQRVTIASDNTAFAVNAAATQSGTWTVQPGNTANTTPWLFNEAQINGVTPLMGNGVSGTGSQRVNIASDNTAFAVNAASTLNAETTKVIGTVRNLGNAGAITDFAGQNAASPANSWLMGAQFNTTPTTLTTGNASPLQMDSAGNLLVNIKAGAGSGGTALADKSAWTVSSTNLTPIGGEFTTGGATACATAQACAVAMTATRGLFTDMNTWAETSLGVPTAYGTAPTTGNYIGVNAFVTNATPGIANNADSIAAVAASSTSPVPVNNYNYLYNGSTFDRQRSGGVTGMAGVALQATPAGAATISSAIAPATPAGVNLKASAGTIYSINVTTIQATPIYVKLYNASSAPTCGSGTPVARFMVPSNATAADGAGTNIPFPVGLAFGTGIGYCVTGALADNDTTAITANNTLVNISWN